MTTPKLTNWAQMLTDSGIELAAYLDAAGATIPPSPAGSLISPAAHYFAQLTPDEAAALWAEFQRETANSKIVVT